MKIFINQEELNFELEKEKNVREIIDGVLDSYAKLDAQISEILVDGKEVALDGCKDYPLTDVKELKLEIVSTTQLIVNSLIEISHYLARILRFLSDHNKIPETEKKNFEEGVLWLNEALSIINRSDERIFSSLFSGMEEDFNVKGFSDFETRTKIFLQEIRQHDNFDTSELKSIFSYLSNNIDNFLRQLQESGKEMEKNRKDLEELSRQGIEEMRELLREMPKFMGSIAELLQEGKDSDAFQQIRIIMEDIQKYIQFIPVLASEYDLRKVESDSEYGENLLQLHQELIRQMKGVADAMENRDTVSISDYFEYELPELLEAISNSLKSLEYN